MDKSNEPDMTSYSKDMTSYSKATPWIAGVVALLAAVGLAAGFYVVNHHKTDEQNALAEATVKIVSQPLPVDVALASSSSNVQPLKLPGQTAAWLESSVYGRVSGYIGEWKVDIGDRVEKGQVLCGIETPELDADLVAAEAKVKATQASVRVEQSNADFAKTTYERWWHSPQGYVSEQEKQQKKAEYDSSMAKLAAAAAQVNLDQANLDRLKAMEGFKRVVAPFAGVITSRRIDIGDLVTAGSTASTTPLYVVAQAEKIRTFVDVPQQSAHGIYVGMPASVTSDEFPGRAFNGTVARTSSTINPTSRTLKVEIDIPNGDMTLLPGMYVDAELQLKQASAVEIPASALLFREAGPEVAVIGDDNRVDFRKVTIAHDNGDVIQIGSGLKANDRVALNISSQVVTGDLVTPSAVEEPAAKIAPAKVAEVSSRSDAGIVALTTAHVQTK
jgi:RND family efflux transporter MFP subunit